MEAQEELVAPPHFFVGTGYHFGEAMRFTHQTRVLDALLHVQEAVNDAMRTLIEQDEDLVELVVEEEKSEGVSDTVLITESEIPSILKPKPSRRPTRQMPGVGPQAFYEYALSLLEKATNSEQRESLRGLLERGLKANLLTQEEADDLLLKLVSR